MPLLLLDSELDVLIQFEAPDHVLAALHEQWARLLHEPEREIFVAQVTRRLLPVLLDCLDWDLKTPTPAQISFATSVAKQLGIDLPADVLQRRSAMGEFLDSYGPIRRRARYTQGQRA
ncbi:MULTISPECIES: hypothetical protein [Xanthomonas]|uniref:hypothetical protein n=1 Tax=Xanthomonas TaxID=338 RepID=UPI0011822CC1|nr:MULTISPECIES: hypothetical protein [Xanthomonas]MCE4518117.1 hypothetical protein [Xanthomonas hortorum pv. vitians]MEA9896334.1 hypothetical protein [Xanthomonas campestris pv. raphani]NIJ76504.1 hypothetical protein [Xanthomonas sp. CFBP 8151]QTK49549.1 hypothetical protein XeaCFBP3836p_10780 [Xanthomonas euvesicatoria pv. alfalfae]